MTSQAAQRAHGVYRVPYDSGIKVKVIGDDGSHFPPTRYDLVGVGQANGVYRIAAAAAGIVRRLVDRFNQNRPNGNPCNNNYVWLEHPNGEWTKYTHLRQGSATAAGLVLDGQVAAGSPVTVTFAPLRRGPLSATLLATVVGSSPYTRLRIIGTGTGGPHVP